MQSNTNERTTAKASLIVYALLGKQSAAHRLLKIGNDLKTHETNIINVKKIAFGNKEHITDQKTGVSVLLKLFNSSNEVCKTAYVL